MVDRMKGKLLCIDVGNTSASYGLYEKGRFGLASHAPSNTIPEVARKLIKNKNAGPFNHAVVSSVVPQITQKLRKALSGSKGLHLWVIGQNLRVPIKHKYHKINQLGTDRLATAYGALKLYGAPILIFDFGTALTCDYVSSKGVFEGGLIIPGPQISLKVLSEKTALLPSIKFPHKSGLLGQDTKSCMEAGILQGYGAMADGLVERFRKRYGKKLRVVATGGLAKTLAPYMSRVDLVDPLLTLKSLALLFKAKPHSS